MLPIAPTFRVLSQALSGTRTILAMPAGMTNVYEVRAVNAGASWSYNDDRNLASWTVAAATTETIPLAARGTATVPGAAIYVAGSGTLTYIVFGNET